MERLISLYEYAENHNIDVDWCTMFRAESLSVRLNDGSCAIAIDPFKLVNTADETYKLAHELGHCETGSFYSQYAPFDERGRNEARATRWAIKKLLPFDEMRTAMEEGYTEPYQLAEYFEVPEDLIQQAVEYYTGPCGLSFRDASENDC